MKHLFNISHVCSCPQLVNSWMVFKIQRLLFCNFQFSRRWSYDVMFTMCYSSIHVIFNFLFPICFCYRVLCFLFACQGCFVCSVSVLPGHSVNKFDVGQELEAWMGVKSVWYVKIISVVAEYLRWGLRRLKLASTPTNHTVGKRSGINLTSLTGLPPLVYKSRAPVFREVCPASVPRRWPDCIWGAFGIEFRV